MVSRRNFFAITIVMCVVFFLFQFLNVAKEHLNDYESNSNVVEISQLTSQKETQNAMAVQQAIENGPYRNMIPCRPINRRWHPVRYSRHGCF